MIIELTQGFVTEVDDADKDLSAYNWYYDHRYAARRLVTSELEYPGRIYLHKTILERKLGRLIKVSMECDHIDRNKLNNRRNNLREVTHLENVKNSSAKTMSRTNTSGYRGVSKNGNGWKAQIRINAIQTYLGTFDLKEEASKVFLDKYHEVHRRYPLEILERS